MPLKLNKTKAALLRLRPVLIVGGVYGALILVVGFWAIDSKDKVVAYVATRYLPANTLLRENDLVKPRHMIPGYFWHLPDVKKDMEGRYLKCPKMRGEKITTDDLIDWPELPPAQTPMKIVPLDKPELVTVLNAGARVLLCAEKCTGNEAVAEVATVICNKPETKTPTSTCYAIVEMSTADEKNLATATKLNVFLRQLP